MVAGWRARRSIGGSVGQVPTREPGTGVDPRREPNAGISRPDSEESLPDSPRSDSPLPDSSRSFEGDGLVYVQPSERNTIAGDV